MAEFGKYLILGSNSFSGASLVAFLLEKNIDVIGISRSEEPHDAFLPYRWGEKSNNFAFKQLDINNDLEKINELIKKERPRKIINFAAQSMVGESWDNPEDWFQTNTLATIKLHNVLRDFDFIEKYVHVTTPEVYGSNSNFIREDAEFNPSTPYAVSRAAADMSLKTFIEAFEFPAVFTRAANVYGAGQQLYRIIPRAILYFKTGKKLELHGGGFSERSFIHIKDVASATFEISKNGNIGDTYHISTDRIVSIKELVELICLKLDVSFEENVEVVGERLGKDEAYKLDSQKIRKELLWDDKVSLEQGVEEAIGWVDKYLPVLIKQPSKYIHKK